MFKWIKDLFFGCNVEKQKQEEDLDARIKSVEQKIKDEQKAAKDAKFDEIQDFIDNNDTFEYLGVKFVPIRNYSIGKGIDFSCSFLTTKLILCPFLVAEYYNPVTGKIEQKIFSYEIFFKHIKPRGE